MHKTAVAKIFVILVSLLSLLFIPFDRRASAADITILTNTTWSSGTYTYDNVLITNSATLTFNGAVTLNVKNLTIDSNSSISADGKGYAAGQGLGAGAGSPYSWGGGGGGAYGGNGGKSYYAAGGKIYGSSIRSADLGSGGGNGGSGSGGKGAGAIIINVSDTLIVNGLLTANGNPGTVNPGWSGYGGGGAGGSINLVVHSLDGSGAIAANGGDSLGNGGGGGGGRIAVNYQVSTFSGKTEAKGGKGYNVGEDGTVAFFDTQNNIFYPGSSFRFQENDSPFNFQKVILNNSNTISQGSINLITNNLIITNSSLTLSGQEALHIINNIILSNNSIVTHFSQGKINLSARNLDIDSTSVILADAKGYPADSGPGKGMFATYAGGGGGYGGRGGNGAYQAKGGSSYGLALTPEDKGSGGASIIVKGGAGAGVIKITLSGTLTLNGKISARGEDGKIQDIYSSGAGSGGSIYVVANSLKGQGEITANGGNALIHGGGGGGGRIAVYYQSSGFTGKVEAKGGIGYQNGENGTVVFNEPSLDSPFTFFNLTEVSSNTSAFSEILSSQIANLNNVAVTGDLNGSLNFTNLEFIKIDSGAFSGKGFSKGSLKITLEGITYAGNWEGMTYFVPSENKIYLKGRISGEISGICEGYLSESISGSAIYDKYQATWRLDRVGVDSTSAAINLSGTLFYQNAGNFTSGVYLEQASLEGSAFGYYTGPLSGVLTHLRIADENEYKGEGFSIISYNSALGQGQAYSYNALISSGTAGLNGLSDGPLLGGLSATLDENQSPELLSGTIGRIGIAPAADLKVRVWGPKNVSPGETVNYIIEYRNDGSRSAIEAILYFYPVPLSIYKSASSGAYYNSYTHRVTWNLGNLSAKTTGYASVQMEIPWHLPAQLSLENRAYILDIILHSTEENGAANGICFDPADINGNKDFEQFTHDNDAKWFRLYANTNFITGPLEAYLASKDIATSRNGVGQESQANGYRRRWIGFSGGGTSFTNQAKQGRISGQELYLISPQVVTQEDIRAVKGQFNKIIVYQGDDLLPDEGIAFKTNASVITIPWSSLPDTLTKDKIIELIEPSDNTIKDLIGKIEDAEGNKTLDYLEIFPQEEGNRIKITWKEAGMPITFLTTYILSAEDGIEVMTIPGIKHDEWFPVLNLFHEKYGRLPIPNADEEKLTGAFNEFRRESSSQSPQEISTAHDPNEILVSPQGDVRPGDRLNYTINYENEGQGNAYGVYVTDVLEEDLDESTVTVNDSGIYDSATRTITWFIGELLSTQKGSLSFSVNVKPDAADKSGVINFATVYFPSAPEVTPTNGVVNRITTYIDNVAPLTVSSISPSCNQVGWNNTDVTMTLTAADNEDGVGLAKTEYSFDSINWLIYTNPLAISNEAVTKVYYRSMDNANNVEVTKSLEIKIDKTPPEVLISVPQNLMSYTLDQNIFSDWSAQDNLSGIDSIVATAPDQQPLNLTSVGQKDFSVSAKDKAGNQKGLVITYKVIYNYSGVLAPIKTDGSSLFKLGSTIPVKFQLKDAQGNFITTAIANLSIQKYSNNEPIGDPIVVTSTAESTTGSLFRYDAEDTQYIFNLSTKSLSTGLWRLEVDLDDGQKYAVFVGLK